MVIFGNNTESDISTFPRAGLRFEKQTQASAFVTIFSCPNIQPRLSSFVFLLTALTANFCISSPDILENVTAVFLKVKT